MLRMRVYCMNRSCTVTKAAPTRCICSWRRVAQLGAPSMLARLLLCMVQMVVCWWVSRGMVIARQRQHCPAGPGGRVYLFCDGPYRTHTYDSLPPSVPLVSRLSSPLLQNNNNNNKKTKNTHPSSRWDLPPSFYCS